MNQGGGASGRSASAKAPSPLAADVGIVAALPIEVGFLLDRLSRVRKYTGAGQTVVEGESQGKVIAVLVGGAGRAAARRAAKLLIEGHRPRWVVSAGFAGALDPSWRRNDAVMPHTILDVGGLGFGVDVKIAEEPSPIEGPRLRTGRLVTVDQVVRTAAEKAALRERTGADLVDMETSAVVATCAERSVRFLAIRVISDEASAELPREVATLMNRTGSRLVGSALRALWNRPSSLKDFLTLHNQAQQAADRLADVLLAAIARLPD